MSKDINLGRAESTIYTIVEENLKAIREAEKSDKKELTISSRYNSGNYYVTNHKKMIGDVIDEDKDKNKHVWVVDRTEIKHDEVENEENDGTNCELLLTLKKVHKEYYYDNLKKINISQREAVIICDKEFGDKMKVGAIVVEENGILQKITGIRIGKKRDDDMSFREDKKNPHHKQIFNDEVEITYVEEIKNDRYKSAEPQWSDAENSASIESFKGDAFVSDASILDYLERIKAVTEKQTLIGVEDSLLIGEEGESIGITDLVGFDSKNQLELNRSKHLDKENAAKAIAFGINRQIAIKKEEMNALMLKQQQQVANILNQTREIVEKVQKEVTKINGLINTLEIYSGALESVLKIRSGEPASADTPISIRQQLYYMDEEVAVTDDQGIDFQTIDVFDNWVATNERAMNSLIPEQRCVVLMRPRRNMKDRGDIHPMLKAQMEDLDRMCYILIRNGENVYRIWTDNIETQGLILPRRSRMQEILDELYTLEKRKKDEGSYYAKKEIQSIIDEKEREIEYYKRILILLQGIIVRTDIFTPVPHDLNILNLESHKGRINFIYDAEDSLTDGRPSFKDWHMQINKKIKKGSRILFIEDLCPSSRNLESSRFSLQWYHETSAPALPDAGVYSPKYFEFDVYHDVFLTVGQEVVNAEEKRFKALEKKYSTTTRYGVGHTSIHYHDIPLKELLTFDFDAKYGSYRRSGGKVEVFAIDKEKMKADGRDRRDFIRKRRKETKHCYKISYNPGGTVYKQRGEFKDGSMSRERRGIITMRVFEDDKFIINYDALTLDDIEYYLNDRVNRKDYLYMMPVLRQLKEELLTEMAEEKDFARGLSARIGSKFNNLAITTDLIDKIVFQKIKWWKEELPTVWKRPLAGKDIRAWSTIEAQVIKELEKVTKQDLGFTFDNREKTLCVTLDGVYSKHLFYGSGFTKKDFISQLLESETFKLINSRRRRSEKLEYTMTGLKKIVLPTDDQELTNESQKQKLIVHVKTIQ